MTREELVEEIGTILYDDVISSPRMKIRRAITRILQAVADGELDEALGVVGRGTITCTTDGREIYHTDWKGRIPIDLPAIERQHAWSIYDFIALRPSGTGKEEER